MLAIPSIYHGFAPRIIAKNKCCRQLGGRIGCYLGCMSPITKDMVPVALLLHDFSRTGVVLNAVRLANALAARGQR
jgi:hypothetical protein